MNIMYIFFIFRKIAACLWGSFIGNIMLKAWGCRMYGLVKCFGTPYIEKTPGSRIQIGSGVILRSSLVSNPAGCFHPVVLAARKKGEIILGNNCGISSSVIVAEKSVTIGDNVLIGVNCVISDTDFHSVSAEIRRTPAADKEEHSSIPVVIEDDVWLGMNVTVLKGVTIGRGSVVAAGSIVTKDLPPHSLAGGNPCKVIKSLS